MPFISWTPSAIGIRQVEYRVDSKCANCDMSQYRDLALGVQGCYTILPCATSAKSLYCDMSQFD
jgi:hypothetical protein